jgi:putative holliday junction resolvase
MSRLGRRAMALDVGEKRIGVAVSDEAGTIATPLTTVVRGRGQADLDEVARLAGEWEVDTLVVGLPTGMSGREGPQAAATRDYADRLAGVVGGDMPLVFWDERLTTAIADRVMHERGTPRADRKRQRDAIAAAVILQGYLDSRR